MVTTPGIAYEAKMKAMREAASKFEGDIAKPTVTIDQPLSEYEAQRYYGQILRAHREGLKNRIIQCLTYLCFPLPHTRDAGGTKYVLWRPVLEMLQQSFGVNAEEWICREEIGIAYLPRHIGEIADKFYPFIEVARRSNPFYHAAAGAQVSASALLDAIDALRLTDPDAASVIRDMRQRYVAQLRTPIGKASGFHSAFISYSNRDTEFAEKLYGDLTARAVHCWFAPKDLKTGDKFRSRIEDSIHTCDKLLVITSANSIQSVWVEEEVETALERERQHKVSVLFPIRVDNAIMETRQAWAANLRRSRHISDFSDWRHSGKYKNALDRLLRDLEIQHGSDFKEHVIPKRRRKDGPDGI